MLTPGTRIGTLVIDRLLGRGAMGEVYAATQSRLGRVVAVKRIAEHLLDDAQAIERFTREAACLARIHHPAVVGIFDAGQFSDEHGHSHWLLIMEFVDGGMSVRALCGPPVPWPQATAVIMHAAQGLAAAAEHGVIHRDVKPDNLMLTRRGQVKLVDFGLARASDSTALTTDGSLLGTPSYMAPEACRGEAASAQGDLYALGCTWFQLLTGRLPFVGANTMAVIRAHLDDAVPDVRAMVHDLPEDLAGLVMALVAKDPRQRPASAAALIAAIQASPSAAQIPAAVPELMTRIDATVIATAPTTKATGPMALTVTSRSAAMPERATPVPDLRPSSAPVSTAATRIIKPDPSDCLDPTATAATAARQSVSKHRHWVRALLVIIAVLVVAAVGVTLWLAQRDPGITTLIAAVADGRRQEAIAMAEARYRELPANMRLARAIVTHLGDGREFIVVRAALTLAAVDQPAEDATARTLLAAATEQEPWAQAAPEIRAALRHHHPRADKLLRDLLVSGDRDQRANAFFALDEGAVLSDSERLRYHVRCVDELQSVDMQVRSAAEWLSSEAAKPNWRARVQAAGITQLTRIASLENSGSHLDPLGVALRTALWPEAQALIKRYADDESWPLRQRHARVIYVLAPLK